MTSYGKERRAIAKRTLEQHQAFLSLVASFARIADALERKAANDDAMTKTLVLAFNKFAPLVLRELKPKKRTR